MNSIVRIMRMPYHEYTDYHLNMLSVSQENFEKASAYSGAQLPLKHLVSRDPTVGGGRRRRGGGGTTTTIVEENFERKSKKNETTTPTCVLCPPPSYPWTNNMSSAEFDKNLILSGLTTQTKFRRKVVGSTQIIKPLVKNLLLTSLKSPFSPTENERVMLEKRALPATADEAFQKNQLAPLTFLMNPLWSNLVPSNFIARAWSCCLNLPCDAYFFVEPKKEKGLFSSRHYVATVTGPSNLVCPFIMRVEADEHGKEIRYAYSFQPLEAGVYTVKVRLAASGTPDVHGSPLKIHVCPRQKILSY